MNFKEVVNSFIKANKEHYSSLKKQSEVSKLTKHNALELFPEVHKNAAPVFVLSTGRCGTQLLSELLARSEQADVFHEPKPELLFLSKKAYEVGNTQKEPFQLAFDAARYESIRDSYINGKLYVETNNRITFLADSISELYPNAKFIHLYRKPESFVKSGLSRNWYSGKHIHDEGRIISKDTAYWQSLSDEEKIAWLWNETNQWIENFKTSLPANRILTVRAEDFFISPAITSKMLQFIGASDIPEDSIKSILSSPKNKSKHPFSRNLDLEKIKKLTPLYSIYYGE